jgi:hypothetical protein
VGLRVGKSEGGEVGLRVGRDEGGAVGASVGNEEGANVFKEHSFCFDCDNIKVPSCAYSQRTCG